jgi:anti-sigma B factor antagonist
MIFTLDKQDKYVAIKLHENKLNSLISPELKSEIIIINNQGHNNIILDLQETEYCDSSGLSAILVGNRICKNSGGCFIITGLQEPVRKLISISQLDQVLLITPSMTEAVDYVFMEEIEKNLPKD